MFTVAIEANERSRYCIGNGLLTSEWAFALWTARVKVRMVLAVGIPCCAMFEWLSDGHRDDPGVFFASISPGARNVHEYWPCCIY